MRKDNTSYISKCLACQRYKSNNRKPIGLPKITPNRQRSEVIAIDLFGALSETVYVCKHIFEIANLASRWTELFPLKDATAENCATILNDEIFLRYGTSRRIVSDSGPQFISAVIQKLTFCMGRKHAVISLYHPQSNPIKTHNWLY